MAITYFKVSNPGEIFIDSSLGVFVNYNNAFALDANLKQDFRLVRFLATGYIIEISFPEYQHLKLISVNDPINLDTVNSIPYYDPVEYITNTPYELPLLGSRYLVGINPTGDWAGYKDHIAQWNGSGWVFYKPRNGDALSVRSLGYNVHYSGTFPSGSWDYDASLITNAPTGQEAIDDALEQLRQLISAEAITRNQAIQELLILISNIQLPEHGHTAVQISVSDQGNYFVASNVEAALQEIMIKLNLLTQEVNDIDLTPANGFEQNYANITHLEIPHTLGRTPIVRIQDVSTGFEINGSVVATSTTVTIDLITSRSIKVILR